MRKVVVLMLLLSFMVLGLGVAEGSAAGQTQSGLAKHEPTWGAFIGATIDRDPAVNNDLSRVPEAYGKNYAMVLVYAQWGEPLPVLSTRAAAEADAALQVAWEPSDGLEAVNDNNYVRQFARKLNDYGNPVFLRFASEMNGEWVPWTGDPALYIEKFRLISQIMREEAPNVAMVWSPNCVPTKNINQYYPGDQYVDWVGVSGYSDYYFIGNPASKESVAKNFFQGKNAQPLSKFDYVYQQYASRKPIMISETGVAWANRNPYEVVAEWGAEHLKRLYRELPVRYPRIKAICYFNVDLMSNPRIAGHSHYLLSGNPLMQQAFREAIANPWYLDSWRKNVPIPIQVELNGRNLAFDVQPVIVDDRVLVPARAVLEAMGATLQWEETTKTVTAKKDGQVLRLQIDNPKATLNGQPLPDMDVPGCIINGRTLLPLRFMAQTYQMQVAWDAQARKVTINN